MDKDLSDYAELKEFVLKKKSGSGKRGAAWTMLMGLFWSLEEGVSPTMIEDVIVLARFEHARKLSEGK